MIEREMLSAKEATCYLGISTSTLWALTSPRGPIPVVRLGRRVLYRRSDLDKFLESVASGSAAADKSHKGGDG